MASFVGIGDLHLTTHVGDSPFSRFEEYLDVSPNEVVLREVGVVMKYVVKNGVPDVFLYGDTGHGARMSYQAQLLLVRLVRKYPKIRFHIIPGNHDWKGAVEDGASREVDTSFLLAGEHSLQLLQEMNIPNLFIYTEPTVVVLQGVRVQFLPYPHPYDGSAFLEDAINVFHNEVKGAKHDNGVSIKHGMEKPSKDVLGLGGHLHTNQRVRNLFFSGTLYQTAFGTQKERFFHHVTYNIKDKKRRKTGAICLSKDEWEVNDVPHVPRYTLEKVSIDSVKDLRKLKQFRDPNVLVKISMNSKVTYAPQEYEKYAKGVKVVGFNPYSHAALEEEVAKMETSQVMHGDEVIINPDDFLRAWLASQNMDDSEVGKMMKLRRKIKRKLQGA